MQIRNDIENILQRITLLTQDHGKNENKLHQNSISYEIFRHISEDYQRSTNFDKNYFVLSWMLSNPEFALEIERLISKDELPPESIQRALLWLTKLFDIKWRQLHDDLDYISKWRTNLQRQTEIILHNLVGGSQCQYKKSNDEKYIPQNRSDIISNIGKTEVEEAIEQDKGNLSETRTTEISEEKFWKNILNGYITTTEKTQIMNQSELLKRIEDNIEDKNESFTVKSTDRKFNVSTDDDLINNGLINIQSPKIKKLRNKNRIRNKISSKFKKLRTLRYKRMKDRGKRFDQLKNTSSISPTENDIDILQEQKTDRPVETNTTYDSLKNVTDVLQTRRTLNILPLDKIEKYDRGNKFVSVKKVTEEHNYVNERIKIKSDNVRDAMDEILEAVAEVLPRTDKSV